jgi:phosphate transport system substrate-binding protein
MSAGKLLSARALLLAACLGCTGIHAAERSPAKASEPLTGKLVIVGSSTMAPMMLQVARRFMAMRPSTQIEVRSAGSGAGIDDVIKGKADIGMISRALTDIESGLFSFAIARDGICVIVHKDNPVGSLTNRQVSDIYTGKIGNWNAVGGKDAPVGALSPGGGAATAEVFTSFFDIRPADLKAGKFAGNNQERIAAIAANPNGITYVSVGAARHQANLGAAIKLLPTNGVAATAKNIRSGDFPISRPLLLLTKGLPTGLAKDFIAFTLSSQVTDLVIQYEFVPYLD